MATYALPIAQGRPLWRAAQAVGVVLTPVLIGALWVWPKPTLTLLWDMVIPLLPAVFLVNPLIWRNVCPLATLNDLSGRRSRARATSLRVVRAGWVLGVALLFVLVPARRFLFNTNGPALAVTIVAVGALALASGLVFARRAGFCTSICPVLPVEKLYGQAPLLPMAGARCQECTLCTPVGCTDLAGSKTLPQTIGPHRRDTGWIRTGFGVFAAAFPGFVYGYFTAVNGELATAGVVYLRVLGFAAVSYGLVALLTDLLRVGAALAMPVLGAVALGMYYWFAAVTLTTAYHAPAATVFVVRAVMAALLAWWLWGMMTRPNGRAVQPSPQTSRK